MFGADQKRNPSHLLHCLKTLFSYHTLIYYLTVRELKARYKNSVLGFVWSLLNPLAMMFVFTAVFTFLAPGHDLPNYPIYILCGLLAWNFHSAGLIASTNSIVGSSNLVKKVYFPREVLPIAAVLAQLVNFLLALLVLFAVLLILRMPFSRWLWVLPFVILLQTLFTIGIGLILSTLNVFYRDTGIVLDVIILAWFFLTPVFYPLDILPPNYSVLGVELNVHRLMYILNPTASQINAYRDILYWGYRTDMFFFLRTAITSISTLAIGYWIFHQFSSRFGEEV